MLSEATVSITKTLTRRTVMEATGTTSVTKLEAENPGALGGPDQLPLVVGTALMSTMEMKTVKLNRVTFKVKVNLPKKTQGGEAELVVDVKMEPVSEPIPSQSYTIKPGKWKKIKSAPFKPLGAVVFTLTGASAQAPLVLVKNIKFVKK